MKHLLLTLLLCAAPLAAADTEAEYTAKLEQRSADILTVLALPDAAQQAKVKAILISHYRTLRDWHDANDPKLKGADAATAVTIKTTLKPIHDGFLKALAETGLKDAQITAVKDKLVYGKVKITYDGYVDMLPTLTDAQKAKIMEMLVAAREEAMDGGSAGEKSAIFKVWKGRIANYLSKEGIDAREAHRQWGERLKAKKAQESTLEEKK